MYELLIGNEKLTANGRTEDLKGVRLLMDVFKRHYGKADFVFISECNMNGEVIAVTNVTDLQW